MEILVSQGGVPWGEPESPWMRRAHDTSSFEVCYLETEQVACETCSGSLWIVQHRERLLQTLERKLWVVSKDKSCRDPECPNVSIIRPEGEGALPLIERSEYGIDVITGVGEMRMTDHLSFRETHCELVKKYGVDISERHVSNLYRIFLSLVRCVNADFEPLRQKLRQQGRLVLSVDGVQFDGVSPVLYVLRDVLSSEILYAERIEKRDAAHLEVLLRRVKDLDIPVTGIISDKEKGLVPAIEQAFPGVKHQFCQSHYLTNVKKPMEEGLGKLGDGVAKVTCAVKGFARKIMVAEEQAALADTGVTFADSSVTAEELELVKGLCKAAVAGGKASGDPILGPAPVKRFERLELVKGMAKKATEKQGEWKLLQAFLVVLALLDQHEALATRLRRQVDIVRHIAHILNFKTTGRQVRRMLRTYLNRLARREPEAEGDAHEVAFIKHVTALSTRYWRGLFHCYDNPDIPRTDNAIEQLFNVFKRHERRITGCKSTSGGPLESFAGFVIEAWSTVRLHPSYTELVRKVPPDRLRAAREELKQLAEPARQRRSIQRDPEAHLDQLLDEWLYPRDKTQQKSGGATL